MTDSYRTLAEPATGEFKDRGSKFFAFAFPASEEGAALGHLEALRQAHFKARHHCYAWRFGMDGVRFRANDDGEPAGTAGRPILGQIDSHGLTDVFVCVVRYFGGTLLGTSGLIQAYKESTADALSRAKTVEMIVQCCYDLRTDYARMPEVMNALMKIQADVYEQVFDDSALFRVGIRQGQADAVLLQFKALLWKTGVKEAETLPYPEGMALELTGTRIRPKSV